MIDANDRILSRIEADLGRRDVKLESIVCSLALKRRQWWMTFLVVFIPAAGTIGALIWAVFDRPGSAEVGLFFGMWVLSGGVGIDVGYHRLLVHRSFEVGPIVRFFLTAAGATACQGPPLYWAAVHRRHHELSDGPDDPHSPRLQCGLGTLRSLWHAHIGWMAHHEVPNTLHYAPDLLKDRVVMYVNRRYLQIAIAGLLLPACIGGALHSSWQGAFAGFLWGGLVRLFFASHFTWSVNSICHMFGSQAFQTDDDSRNLALFAIPTFGESWHNNHHAFPSSARFGMRWWQLDLGYLTIKALACLGLAFDVRTNNGNTRVRT